jgi:hypothetical protein
MTDTQPAAPHGCSSCGTSIEDCDTKLLTEKKPCCGKCAFTDTHADTPSTFPERMAARAAGNAEHWAAQVDADGVKTEPEPGTDLVSPDGLQQALMAAAEQGAGQALANVPAPTEFAHLCQMARMLSMSDLAPKKLRDKPYDTLLILLTARDLHIPITSALRKVSIIEGQPSIDTELQIALVRQRGFGAVLPVAENFTQTELRFACAIAVGPNGLPLGPPVVFTWDDAQMAGYVDQDCLPEAHARRRITRKNRDGSTRTYEGCECKDNWRTVPRDMLWWRAAARCRRIYFPEATTGMYDADELGGVINVEGHLVDPTTAPLPDGFEDPNERRQQQTAAADQAADGADLWALQERIRALPAAVRDEMRQAWKENERIGGRPPWALPQRLLKLANSMLTGWEASARRADKSWDRDQARQQVREEIAYQLFYEAYLPLGALRDDRMPDYPEPETAPEPATAPVEPQEPSEAAPGPDTAPEAPEAQGDDPGDQPQDAEPDDRDWSAELREASAALGAIAGGVDEFSSKAIEAEIRTMSWQAVDKALAAANIPTDGPPDLRRMRLSILRHTEYQEPF